MALGLTPLTVICNQTLFDSNGIECFTKDKLYKTDGYINYYNKIPDEVFVLIDNELNTHAIADKWKEYFQVVT